MSFARRDRRVGVNVRPYERRDAEGLWELKRAFELELGSKDDEKTAKYEGKLTEEYRERYLAWVTDCVERDPGCLLVAERDGNLAGYAFVLPDDFVFIWDAAVLNELYLAPEHRGTDTAAELVSAASAHARTQNPPLDRLVLDVDPANERARAFYQKAGFEPWAEMLARTL